MTMKHLRTIRSVGQSQPTIEGAGVHLKRGFGYYHVPQFDPFLLFDDFHSEKPEDYLPGFPWHPHRGIETVTYILHGQVEHGDSMGNKGVISSGDVQWMTAGRGIIHQEMPQKTNALLWGFQLWVNLPASHKMMPPRYRDVTQEQIPKITLPRDIGVNIISGTVNGVSGPVQDIVVDIEFLDVSVPPQTTFEREVHSDYTVFTYVIEGSGYFDEQRKKEVLSEHVVLFDKGELIRVTTGESPVRFLLLAGQPLGEPVAWRGPIVMNTQQELDTAFREYRNGTFLHHSEEIRSSHT